MRFLKFIFPIDLIQHVVFTCVLHLRQIRFTNITSSCFDRFYSRSRGWSGGAMVLGKLPVPGRPTSLDCGRARAYCACSRCGWGCLDIFTLIYPFFTLSPSLWETARYRLKYCLKGPLSPKQPTNQNTVVVHFTLITSDKVFYQILPPDGLSHTQILCSSNTQVTIFFLYMPY